MKKIRIALSVPQLAFSTVRQRNPSRVHVRHLRFQECHHRFEVSHVNTAANLVIDLCSKKRRLKSK